MASYRSLAERQSGVHVSGFSKLYGGASRASKSDSASDIDCSTSAEQLGSLIEVLLMFDTSHSLHGKFHC